MAAFFLYGCGTRINNLAYIHKHCAYNTYSKTESLPIELESILKDYLDETPLSDSPYRELTEFFVKQKQKTIRLSFQQIENILQDRLPWEAHFYDSFWYDDNPDITSPLWKQEGF